MLVLLQSTIVWLMEKLSSGTKQITCLFHAAKMVLHWRSSVFLSMCVFSDVIGVPSEASLHSGVQGVLGGEGKLHMVLKQASKHFLCVQFPLYNLSKGGVYGRYMSEWALILQVSGFCSVSVKWFFHLVILLNCVFFLLVTMVLQGCYVCIVTGHCEGGDMWVYSISKLLKTVFRVLWFHFTEVVL